jgi:2-(1,2-epoxy-1,2-dihydrophenyl)acetyl-CoA isomerase
MEVNNGVARLRLNRPEIANGVDVALAKDLLDKVRAIGARPDVRAVVLSGNGRMFCGGGDLAGFAAHPDLPAHVREITRYLHAAIASLVGLDAPVIVAVHGAAAGAGLGLVGAADLAIAGESARFVMAYTRIGLTPDGSTTWFLPRLIGERRALELALLNRALTAAEALQWGLVNRVVPDDDLLPEAEALAATLATGPTVAYGETKRLLRASWSAASLEVQMAEETEQVARAASTADAREGIAAFLEKRSPSFSRIEE